MRKLHSMFISLLIALLLAGCKHQIQVQELLSSDKDRIAVEQKPSQVLNDVRSETIQVYGTDAELTRLLERDVTIQYLANNVLDKLERTMDVLQQDAEDFVALWEPIEVNTMQYKEGLVTIDVTIPTSANYGSSGEAFTLDALYQTLFQFTEVKQIEITIDGLKAESLMGHIELMHPMERPY